MTNAEHELATMGCEACRSGAPKMVDDEISELMPQIPEWEKLDIKDVPRLRRTFTFEGWLPAVEFVNQIARFAEENDHHPQIKLEWGRVQVSWWTHKIKGLHKNDFIMAAKTDGIWRARQ